MDKVPVAKVLFIPLQVSNKLRSEKLQGQEMLKQHKQLLFSELSSSDFQVVGPQQSTLMRNKQASEIPLRFRAQGQEKNPASTNPVEDVKNSDNENVTDGQATIGYKLAQARNCLGVFVRSHELNTPPDLYPSVERRSLGTTLGAHAGSGPQQGRCDGRPPGWQSLLAGDAVSLHSRQGLACRRWGQGMSFSVFRLGHSSVLPRINLSRQLYPISFQCE